MHFFQKIKKKNVVVWFFVSLLVATAGLAPAKVLAMDAGFRASNRQFFSAPELSCAAGVGEGTTVLVGNENLEKILRYYVGKGLTLAQASGIAGNFKAESGFNPNIEEGGRIVGEDYTPIDGKGFGLAQWTFKERQGPLMKLANETSRKYIDLGLQLDFSWQELTGGYIGALNNLKASPDAGNAAYVFHRDYEGSADTEEMILKNRGAAAIAIHEQFKGTIPDGASTLNVTTASASSAGSCSGDGKAAGAINGFVVYNQNDPKWDKEPYGESTIGAAGCGPSAMAMIITSLTKTEVTPKQTADYGAANGTLYENGNGGSLHNIHSVIGGHWGLKSRYMGKDIPAINEGLRGGGLLILAGDGAAPFTTGGHFIVVRAVTSDGMWLIGDSNSDIGQENSTKEWKPEDILEKVHTGYSWLLEKGDVQV